MYLTVKEIMSEINWRKSPQSLFQIANDKNLVSVLRTAKIDFRVNEFTKVVTINVYDHKFQRYIGNIISDQIIAYQKKKSANPPTKILEYINNNLELLSVSKLLFAKLIEENIWVNSTDVVPNNQLRYIALALNIKTSSRKLIFSQIKNLKTKVEGSSIYFNVKNEYTKEFVDLFKTRKSAEELLATVYFEQNSTFTKILKKINELSSNPEFLFELNKLVGNY